MTIFINRKAAIIAVIASLPVVVFSTYHWILAYTIPPSIESNYHGIIGFYGFMLGSPLTLLYTLSAPYIGTFLRWTIGNELDFLVIPVMALLFIAQWVIWSQLIVIGYRKFIKWRGIIDY